MTISLLSKASGNPNLDNVFDLYVQGTSPPATGLLDDSGTDIATRYAPLSFGSQAAATGLLTKQSGNADIYTLFAAKGTAQYPLGCNGQAYTGSIMPSGTATQNDLSFNFNFTSTTAWAVNGSGLVGGNSGGTFSSNFSGATGSGALNSGATAAQITSTYLAAAGDTGPAKAITNNYASKTNITANNAFYFQQYTPVGATHQSTYQVKVVLYNSAGAVLSTSTFTVMLKSG